MYNSAFVNRGCIYNHRRKTHRKYKGIRTFLARVARGCLLRIGRASVGSLGAASRRRIPAGSSVGFNHHFSWTDGQTDGTFAVCPSAQKAYLWPTDWLLLLYCMKCVTTGKNRAYEMHALLVQRRGRRRHDGRRGVNRTMSESNLISSQSFNWGASLTHSLT